MNARAISTPSRNETILRNNVTFFDQSGELSEIPVLSPPSTTKRPKTASNQSSSSTDTTGESRCSFR